MLCAQDCAALIACLVNQALRLFLIKEEHSWIVPTLTMMAGEAKTGTSLTLISALSVGGLAVYVVYWRFLRSQAEPCRLKAPTTALQALAFHTCSHTESVSSLHLGATPVHAASHFSLCFLFSRGKKAGSLSGAAGKAKLSNFSRI